jgi:hypothetical protein
MKLSRFVVPALLGLMCLSSIVRDACADSIGINFLGSGGNANAIPAGANVGVGVVPQNNWNNIGGFSGTTPAFMDSNGAMTTTTLTYSFQSKFNLNSVNGGFDELFNAGTIYQFQDTPLTFRLNNISYSNYDIYVYNLAFSGTQQQTTLGSTSFYSTSPDPNGAGYVDSNRATPYIYTQATSTTAGVFTPNANYVRFTGLSGNSQSFSVTGLNNFGQVGGIQLVQRTVATPEPSTYAMMALGCIALCVLGAKRKKDGQAI